MGQLDRPPGPGSPGGHSIRPGGLVWEEWNEEVETRAILKEAESLIAAPNAK